MRPGGDGMADQDPRLSLQQEQRQEQPKQGSQPKDMTPGPEEEEELFVSEEGLISTAPVDDKSRLEQARRQLAQRDKELRQAAEYGLGLLEAHEEVQLKVATLEIQLETRTTELEAERDTFQRRMEHAQQESASWKRKFARVEEEKAALAEELEQFVDRCECHGPSGGRRPSHHLDTIAQLQEENAELTRQLEQVRDAERSNAAALEESQRREQTAERQQQELRESEDSYVRMAESQREALQRTIDQLQKDKKQLAELGRVQDAEAQTLRKQLQLAEEAADDIRVDNNALTERVLSAEARGKRLQRELELMEHVSYFSEAVMDRDDEESDEDDEIAVDRRPETSLEKTSEDNSSNNNDNTDGASTPPMLSPLSIRRRRSTATTAYSAFPTTHLTADGTRVKTSASELETHKKLHHYFHLTAQSIIHENHLHERCFSSSSRVTIDMWYREIIAKDVPFLEWHAWLIDRISLVAAEVQDDDAPPPSAKIPGLAAAFHGFSLRKRQGSGSTPAHLSSPATTSSSPASSPSKTATRVSFSVARAFFRLLRKSTSSGDSNSPANGSPVAG